MTLSPHSNHKIQPLDQSHFKSLKSAYNAADDSWRVVSKPVQRLSQYELEAVLGKAYMNTATAEKAVNGLTLCVLWPYEFS